MESAYFDRGPVHEEHLVLGGYWSTYWYNGKVYGTEIARGLDVLSLVPSEHLSENEIAAALIANQGELFNPQQQFRITWPANPVVAGAYIDQLVRSDDLSESELTTLNTLLEQSSARLEIGGQDISLARNLSSIAANLDTNNGDVVTNKRRAALAETLDGIASRLR